MESLPAWDDKPGVAKLADRLLADHDALAQRYIDFVERIEDIRQPFIEPSEITTGAEYEAMVQFAREVTKFKKAERAAVAAFHRGDRKPLQALVCSSYYSGWLDPSAHALLGKRKKRIRKHPNHDAARAAGTIFAPTISTSSPCGSTSASNRDRRRASTRRRREPAPVPQPPSGRSSPTAIHLMPK